VDNIPQGQSHVRVLENRYMGDFLKMDVFFLVTTIAVLLSIFFGAVLFWRLSRIFKNIEHISKQVALESDNIRLDLAELRTDVRRGKGRLKSLINFFGKTARRTSKDS